jgi:hypothetical protein
MRGSLFRKAIAMPSTRKSKAGQANLDILTGHPTKAGLSEIDTHWPLFLRATARPWSEANDPRVRAAHQSVTVATEQDHLAAHSYMPNPEIGVGVINQGRVRFAMGHAGWGQSQDADPSDVTSVPVRTRSECAFHRHPAGRSPPRGPSGPRWRASRHI